MKKRAIVLGVVILCLLVLPAYAQVPVNIVYPLNGATYPLADITPATRTVASAYITASFGVTCGGGAHTAKWGFDGTTLGEETFYDMTSVQQVYKLPAGTHSFWVATDCGKDSVQFMIK